MKGARLQLGMRSCERYRILAGDPIAKLGQLWTRAEVSQAGGAKAMNRDSKIQWDGPRDKHRCDAIEWAGRAIGSRGTCDLRCAGIEKQVLTVACMCVVVWYGIGEV